MVGKAAEPAGGLAEVSDAATAQPEASATPGGEASASQQQVAAATPEPEASASQQQGVALTPEAEASTTSQAEASASQQQLASLAKGASRNLGSGANSVIVRAADTNPNHYIVVAFRELAKVQWSASDILRYYKGLAWPLKLAICSCCVRAKALQSSMPISGEDWSSVLRVIQIAAHSLIKFAHQLRYMHISLTGNVPAIAANKEALHGVQELLSLVHQINSEMTSENGRAACRTECCELYWHTVAATKYSWCLSREFSECFSRLSDEADHPLKHYHNATAVARVVALADLARTCLNHVKDAQAQQSKLHTALATVSGAGGGWYVQSLYNACILSHAGSEQYRVTN